MIDYSDVGRRLAEPSAGQPPGWVQKLNSFFDRRPVVYYLVFLGIASVGATGETFDMPHFWLVSVIGCGVLFFARGPHLLRRMRSGS